MMFNLSKIIAGNLIVLTFCNLSVTILEEAAFAGELIIDNNCQFHHRKSENIRKIPLRNRGSIYFNSAFFINNQKYFLQVLKFPNSTSVFCLLNSNYQKNKRLNQVEYIQNKQIEKVEKLSQQKAIYIVTVKGNENEDVFRTFYRLNLTNPYQPKITPIIKIYKK